MKRTLWISHLVVLAAFAFCPDLRAVQAGQAREIGTRIADPRFTLPLHIDQDGRLDLLVISYAAGESRIFRNHEDGLLDPVQFLDTLANTTQAIAMDVDGDGVEDIVVNRELMGDMQWFRGLGTGRFDGRSDLMVSSGRLYDPAAGDIDGDGRADLVVGTAAGPAWFRNLGGGAFGAETLISPLASGESKSLALGDFDGDGDLDVVADSIGTSVNFHANLGSGSFMGHVTVATGQSGPVRIRAADVDSDGLLDLLLGWGSTKSIGLVTNLGSAVFASENTVVFSIAGPPNRLNFVVRDLNEDGRLDLLMELGWSAPYASYQTSVNTFSQELRLGPDSLAGDPDVVHDADLNGDGKTDVLTFRDTWIDVHLALPGSSTNFDSPRNLVGMIDRTNRLISSDVDQDGDLDVLVASDFWGLVNVMMNSGGGEFESPRRALPERDALVVHDAGDVIGDAFPDLLVSFWDGTSVQLFLAEGVGDGTFGAVTSLFTHGNSANARARLGDLDADGDLDVVLADGDAMELYWLENLGAGSMSPNASVLHSGAVLRGQIDLEDVDGDGRLDIGFRERLSLNFDQIRWLRNRGAGAFELEPPLGEVSRFVKTIGYVDVDGDGDVDAVWASNLDVVWARNDGAQGFASRALLFASAELNSDVQYVDIDVDGDLDLLLLPPSYSMPFNPARHRIVENLGGGVFSAEVELPFFISGSPHGHIADLDLDGADDLLIARELVGQLYLVEGGAARIIGESVCGPAVLNSVGLDGRMSARGSTVAGDNEVRLIADRLTPGSFGYFLASQTLTSATPIMGSQGRICLGGAIGQFVGPGQVMRSSDAGRFTLDLDLLALPSPSGFVPAMAGETWGFQAWHRDVAPPTATSNFTDTIALTWR